MVSDIQPPQGGGGGAAAKSAAKASGASAGGTVKAAAAGKSSGLVGKMSGAKGTSMAGAAKAAGAALGGDEKAQAKLGSKAAGIAAKTAVTAATGGGGAVVAPVVGKVVEVLSGPLMEFAMKHKGITIAWIIAGTIPFVGIVFQIPIGMMAAVLWTMDD